MASSARPGQPSLVVLAPEGQRGRRIELSDRDLIVGRAAEADVRFDDPYVSRRHAALRRRGSQVLVEDLGSRSGTTVNGRPASAMTVVGPGDVVRFATVEMMLDAGSETGAPPAASAADSTGSRFDLRDQRAGILNNVGRDQNVSYVAHIRQERESFLREIAATKTKARYLVWSGLSLYAVGFALFAYAILRTMARISSIVGSSEVPPSQFPDFFGTPVFGIPLGLLGFGLAGIGTLLLVFGIALHVVASARRRRLDRDLPRPDLWPTS